MPLVYMLLGMVIGMIASEIANRISLSRYHARMEASFDRDQHELARLYEERIRGLESEIDALNTTTPTRGSGREEQ